MKLLYNLFSYSSNYIYSLTTIRLKLNHCLLKSDWLPINVKLTKFWEESTNDSELTIYLNVNKLR